MMAPRGTLLTFFGVLLSLTVAWAGTETVLHTFASGSDGNSPADIGRLARYNGGLYGTTQGGGPCGRGTVFKVSKSRSGWNETILYDFCSGDGANPVGSVVLDSLGNIYGTTKFGATCGTVFKLSGSTLTTLHTFTCGQDGGKPDAGVILDKNGNIYGTTTLYGAHGNGNGGGVVYEISSSGVFSVLYAFCAAQACADGNSPEGGLTIDGTGALYGTTFYGGDRSCNCGTVFKLFSSGGNWVETVIHRFVGGAADGAWPAATVSLGTQIVGTVREKAIFGITTSGGANNSGAVFEILKAKSGYNFELVHSFAGLEGSAPFGAPKNKNGFLIGTTYSGGTGGAGTVFELSETDWSMNVLYNFSGGGDGGQPISGVASDSNGNVYGITTAGGYGYGVVYRVAP